MLWKQLVVSQVYAKNELRIGVSDSGHFDGFRVPLSSAPFCICLVIKNFQKATEDRSPADTGTQEAGGRKDQAPLPWISSSLLRNSVIFKADSSLLCRGRQVFSPRLPPRHTRHLRHISPVYLRNVQAYILGASCLSSVTYQYNEWISSLCEVLKSIRSNSYVLIVRWLQ